MTVAPPSTGLRLELSGFLEGVWNPEDLVDLPGSPWIVVSAMRSARRRGGLLAVTADGEAPAIEIAWSAKAERGRLGADVFDPHGIAVRPLGSQAYELLVIDHGGGEAVDRLRLEICDGEPIITDAERIPQPARTSGNALAHVPDGGFVLTSMFDPGDGETLSKFARGEVTSGVWRWETQRGWSRFGGLGLSGANGIAVTADGAAVFVSEWSARRVWRLDGNGEPQAHWDTTFLPDNLRWDGDRLLLAGQAARPEAVFGCEARGDFCPLAFEVIALDPPTMTQHPLIQVNHEQALAIGFGGATGALRVRDEVWVGSFTGERIARYQQIGRGMPGHSRSGRLNFVASQAP